MEVDAPLDLNEGFIFSATLSKQQVSYLHPVVREKDYIKNLWPAGLPEMPLVMHCYYEAIKHLAFRIHELLQSALDFTVPPLAESSSLARINYYPPVTTEPAENQWRISKHDDLCLFTILLPEPKEGKATNREAKRAGLEVLHKTQGWSRAVYDPGCFVINCGDTMKRASVGTTGKHRCESSFHRVSVPAPTHTHDNSRVSIAYFVHAEHHINQASVQAYQDLIDQSL